MSKNVTVFKFFFTAVLRLQAVANRASAILAVAALVAVALSPTPVRAEELIKVREIRYVMGTRAEVTLYHSDRHSGLLLIRKAFEIAEDLDRMLSNFKPTSEITRLNADTKKQSRRVSPQLYQFLKISRSLTQRTDGAFDITVQPLLQLWRIARQKKKLPERAELQAALVRIGVGQYTLLPDNTVRFGNPAVEFQSGGIGKGYALDLMIRYLRGEGIQHALINIGESSIGAIGAPPGEQAWQVMFAFADSAPLGVVRLRDATLSASDSHASAYSIDDTLYGHIIDPLTGIPATDRVQAAAVAASGAEAEALTKFLVLRGWNNPTAQKYWSSTEVYLQRNDTLFMTKEFPLVK